MRTGLFVRKNTVAPDSRRDIRTTLRRQLSMRKRAFSSILLVATLIIGAACQKREEVYYHLVLSKDFEGQLFLEEDQNLPLAIGRHYVLIESNRQVKVPAGALTRPLPFWPRIVSIYDKSGKRLSNGENALEGEVTVLGEGFEVIERVETQFYRIGKK